MALVWDITPAADGMQYSRYRDGETPDAPPVAPQNLRLAPGYPTYNAATVLWSFTPRGDETGFEIESFETLDPAGVTVDMLGISERFYALPGDLVADTSYTVRVRAVSGTIKGAWSNQLAFVSEEAPNLGETDLDKITRYSTFSGFVDGTPGPDTGHVSYAGADYSEVASDPSVAFQGRKYLVQDIQAIPDLTGTTPPSNAVGYYVTTGGTGNLREGDETWFRAHFRVNPEWSWYFGGNSFGKFYRHETRSAPEISNNGRGKIEPGFYGGDGSGWYLWRGYDTVSDAYKENGGSGGYGEWADNGVGPAGANGQWMMVEWKITWSSDPQKSKVEIWENGEYRGAAVIADTATQLQPSATHGMSEGYGGSVGFITYWNYGAPDENLWLYVDSFAYAEKRTGGNDDTPFMALDAGGRRHIGTAV